MNSNEIEMLTLQHLNLLFSISDDIVTSTTLIIKMYVKKETVFSKNHSWLSSVHYVDLDRNNLCT